MLNYIWAGMIIVGMVYGAFCGNLAAVGDGVLNSAKEAVSLCITMLGVMCVWTGLMEVARESGIIGRLSRRLEPFVNFMFPRIKEEKKAKEYIVTNIIANILGLGWAATPAGLKAMKELGELNEERCRQYGGIPTVASDEMCTFLILNISSLQLIPVNVIAYRSQYGSVNPTVIVGPAIIATVMSTAAAVIYCKIRQKKQKA